MKRVCECASTTHADPSEERSSKWEERSKPRKDEPNDVTDEGEVCVAAWTVEQSEEEGGEGSHHARHDGADDQDGVGRGGRLGTPSLHS